MKKYSLAAIILLVVFLFAFINSIKAENSVTHEVTVGKISKKSMFLGSQILIDKTIIDKFFLKYPESKKYQQDVFALYKKREYKPIWFNETGLIEFANLLYSKVNQLEEEGLKFDMVYRNKIDEIFDSKSFDKLSQIDTEIMLSTLYVFYAKKVFHGIDTEKVRDIGWFLPRKKLSFDNLLNSILVDNRLLNKDEQQLFGQYYKLREALKKYRQIEKNNSWNLIEKDISIRFYKPFDSSKTIGQIRSRLYVMGDLKQNSESNVYDDELKVGILNFKKRNGFKENYLILPSHIDRMNLPIKKYLSTIMVNMERCRWIDPNLSKADEYIIVNIPSLKLIYKRKGKIELESNVIVGTSMNKTIIFSATMNSIVFSPYWNVPKSIIENELPIALAHDKNYLASHEMEWYDGKLRQKPGPKNPMGQIKFMFPNANDIYLHDTPNKSFFEFNYRALSHGCINMEKAKELAILILKNDPEWSVERINEAMNKEKETTYLLKNKIPVYIGYFTSWVDDNGIIHFYDDLYKRDEQLASLLFE